MARHRWSFFMSPREHGFIRALDDGWRNLLTPSGRMVLVGTGVATLVLLAGIVQPTLWVFSGGVALLASALVVGLAFRPRLELERRPLPPVSVGDVVAYRVRVANRGRRTARLVSVAERRLPVDLRPHGAPPVIDALAPGEVREVTLRLECVGRGAHTLTRLQAASAFPSGLVRLGAASSRADRLVVYPRPLELPGLEVPLGRNLQPGGVAVASKVGDSPELLGTREWRDGDRLRDVHWAASARTGRWVVREFQEEYFVRLALVLDVEARSRREDASAACRSRRASPARWRGATPSSTSSPPVTRCSAARRAGRWLRPSRCSRCSPPSSRPRASTRRRSRPSWCPTRRSCQASSSSRCGGTRRARGWPGRCGRAAWPCAWCRCEASRAPPAWPPRSG